MNCFRSPDADPTTGCGVGEQGEAMFTLTKTNHHAVAQPIAFTTEQTPKFNQDQALTLTKSEAKHNQSVLTAMAVRRLTPTECERLQGFPDGYTDIQPNGKLTPDGPRYKALGNSMAVPVMKWIGERIGTAEKARAKAIKQQAVEV
jgi:DNA (cytosine-5)-methyltransferase 1